MDLFRILASAALLCLLYLISRFYRNYLRAKSTGFPLRLYPVPIGVPLYSVLSGPIIPLAKRFKWLFPHSVWRTFELGLNGFERNDRQAKRERQTPGYLVVSCSNTLELFVEDAELLSLILTRRRDFEQDSVTATIMNVFGPALAGSAGEAWSRQRRLVAPMLNEKIMETVWNESHVQADQMLSHFMQAEGGKTSGTAVGLRQIAFNILSTIGYGMETKWSADAKRREQKETMSFMDALLRLVDGLIIMAVMPPWLLKKSWMPASMRVVGQAYDRFLELSADMLQEERNFLKSSSTPRNYLLSSLASINDEDAGPYEKEGRLNKLAFTEDQITGNLYTFTLGGYDTTANTMAYTFAMLAIRPEWQNWIMEEIDMIRKNVSDPNSYKEVLPRLERCLSVMFETLRIFMPIAHILRECATDQVVNIRGKTYCIPANTRCTLSLDGLTVRKETWGEDSFEFRPSRWTSKQVQTTGANSIPQVPNLEAVGSKGSFRPWSGGPRACPGMKMAQTEFLSVVYTVFSAYRVEPVLEMGESLEQGRERLEAVVMDSSPKLTLGMKRPDDLKLQWIRR